MGQIFNYFNPQLETLPRETLRAYQLERLRMLITELDGSNQFYTARLRAHGATAGDFTSFEHLRQFPFTTKQQLIEDQQNHPPFGTNLTYALSEYTRYHETSGTTGKPLKVLDTAESWDWWGQCWGYVLAASGLSSADRLFIAFSFGPFIGFWAAAEGARHISALMIPGGGRDSLQRLILMRESGATALVSTPTYALHLAEVARAAGFDLPALQLRATIHAGEPGASLPATKRKIEEAWGAPCYDHAGATEVGAHSFECQQQPGGTHINEAEFIAEVVDPETGRPVSAGEQGELVLTNLGRYAFPVIRYRTGDIVRVSEEKCECLRTWARCQGGIIGRVDDMVTVRGVNLFPSALENLVRAAGAIDEFRVTVTREKELDELNIEIECAQASNADETVRRLTNLISGSLGLRANVTTVERNSLPRFELKARRFHVKR